MRLKKLMHLRGAIETPGRDASAAARRCAQCRFAGLCDEALAAGDVRQLSLFCPNYHYVQRLRAGSLTFK